MEVHEPRFTVQDILETREYLQSIFPAELIDLILNAAEHWVQVSASMANEAHVTAWQLEERVEKKCLTVEPITGGLHRGASVSLKPRKVVFRLVSCDQGWSDASYECKELKGTYKKCWSWFDVSIGPGDKDKPHEAQERRWHLQYNVHASHTHKRHEVTWSSNEGGARPGTGGRAGTGSTEMVDETTGSGFGIGFLDAMTGEWQISVYACAQQQLWENNVFSAEVDVFYHVWV